jgi:hypothetical protein
MQLKDCKFNKENENMNKNLDSLMCIFCQGFIADKMDYTKTLYCQPCNEYKGVVTVREFLEVYA